jgi:hypothetical protein
VSTQETMPRHEEQQAATKVAALETRLISCSDKRPAQMTPTKRHQEADGLAIYSLKALVVVNNFVR